MTNWRVETFGDLQQLLEKTYSMPNEDVLTSFFKANSNLNMSRIDSHSQIEDLLKKIPSNVNLGSPDNEKLPRVASLDYIRAFLNNQHNNGMTLNRDNSLFSPEKSLSLPPQFDLDGQTLMETTRVKLPTIMDINTHHDAAPTAGAGNTITTNNNILSPAPAAPVDTTLNNAQIAAFNPAFVNDMAVLPKSVPTSDLAGMSAGSAGGGDGGATSLRKRAARAATGKKRNTTTAATAADKLETHNVTNGGGGTATGASSETGLDDDNEGMMLMMEGANGSGDKQVVRRERRMMSNRESARRSRKRKQEYLVNLEKEVVNLRVKVEELSKMIVTKDTEMVALKIENEMLRGGFGGQK